MLVVNQNLVVTDGSTKASYTSWTGRRMSIDVLAIGAIVVSIAAAPFNWSMSIRLRGLPESARFVVAAETRHRRAVDAV